MIDLADATADRCGAKAATLGLLLREGFPVPPGIVLPFATYRSAVGGRDLAEAARRGSGAVPALIEAAGLPPGVEDDLGRALAQLPGGDGYLAVRSSASTEDGVSAAAAGQHESILGVRGVAEARDAALRCWASLWSDRAVAYRDSSRDPSSGSAVDQPAMAVLIQPLIAADVAGVMFTGDQTRVEASWGLGEPVVSGRVTPDGWTIENGVITARRVATKTLRTDHATGGLRTRPVPDERQREPCLNDAQLRQLARFGERISKLISGPQDIEWAIADDWLWIVQARPVTASLPGSSSVGSTRREPEQHAAPRPARAVDGACQPETGAVWRGIPASPGRALGQARVLHSPAEAARLHPGDVLVCRTTDPAWTPLFGLAAAVVTETGGVLCHAAIVAREHGIPAVVAVDSATTVPDGTRLEVDGAAGRVHLEFRGPSG